LLMRCTSSSDIVLPQL